ncbi:MAG: GH3 auxin-responsive promoter family protein [Flavobacteriales bacterium]|nr:GH3 auxin-responsive promoter family protein [Flavobacteriales bacterium]MBL6869725.1 GH3 auxin-responsive promoter family protein [Flavobacteriales bacterium]
MKLLNSVVRETVRLGKPFRQSYKEYGYIIQQKALRRLLEKAKNTAFGKNYGFTTILNSENSIECFQQNVPVFNYQSIYDQWWSKSLKGEKNVCWPGKVKYFALTSGTSEASSKRIPITSDQLQSIIRTSTNQLLTLSDYSLSKDFYNKSILMLGGSTDLVTVDDHFEGDLSGILYSKLPIWFNHFYKPGKKIASEKDWNTKLDLITKSAKDWDIGIIAGVPAWIQILMEKIVDYYKVQNIHEIWPNLKFFIHGGVNFEPYRKGFSKYLGEEIYYQETYLASEGYLAFKNGLKSNGMQLVLNNGTFFEFVPFNKRNFSPDGCLMNNHETLLLDDVNTVEEYAILISTNAGAWRYLLGDTIKFTSLENYEIVITGRTKHFLSLCGEHLSIDNMNKAIQLISNEFDLDIREYTVAGIPYNNLFAHKWFIGSNKEVDNLSLKQRLDEILMELNDDYKTERKYALKEIIIEVLPNHLFYKWMKLKGKEGGQNKFPRVLNKQQFEEWEQFLFNEKRKICWN